MFFSTILLPVQPSPAWIHDRALWSSCLHAYIHHFVFSFPKFRVRKIVVFGPCWELRWYNTERLSWTFSISALLKPIQFDPYYCHLLAMDCIAYGCQQLISAAPGARFQGVVEQRQGLQLQLLGLAHFFHDAVRTTPRKKLPISSVERVTCSKSEYNF